MPLTLDTPIVVPGLHGGTSISIGAVKVAWFAIDIDSEELFFRTRYGNIVNGNFVTASGVPQKDYCVRNILAYQVADEQFPASPDFDLMVATAATTSADEIFPGDGGHKVYRGASRNIYEWLVAKGHYQGLIV